MKISDLTYLWVAANGFEKVELSVGLNAFTQFLLQSGLNLSSRCSTLKALTTELRFA